jgi:hypothetical protein
MMVRNRRVSVVIAVACLSVAVGFIGLAKWSVAHRNNSWEFASLPGNRLTHLPGIAISSERSAPCKRKTTWHFHKRSFSFGSSTRTSVYTQSFKISSSAEATRITKLFAAQAKADGLVPGGALTEFAYDNRLPPGLEPHDGVPISGTYQWWSWQSQMRPVTAVLRFEPGNSPHKGWIYLSADCF